MIDCAVAICASKEPIRACTPWPVITEASMPVARPSG
jgi:hypothetical protein